MTSYELSFQELVVGLRNQITIILLNCYPLIVFWRYKNHITFIFIKTMSRDLLVKMVYWNKKEIPIKLVVDLRMAEIRWGFSISHKTPPFLDWDSIVFKSWFLAPTTA